MLSGEALQTLGGRSTAACTDMPSVAAAVRPTEKALQVRERMIVGKAREWGLDRVPTGLSGLELLAKLQHTGSPTRLIDASTILS